MYRRLSLIASLFLMAVLSSMTPVAAQTSPWTAIYYPNTNFTDPIPQAYTYPTLNLNFGQGPPVDATGQAIPGMPVDNFSARFSSVQNLPAGNYVFSVNVDDRAVVRLNGVQVLNVALPDGNQSVQVTLPGGNINMEVDFIEFTEDAFITLTWQPIGAIPGQPPAPGQPTLDPLQPTLEPTETPRPTITPLPEIPPGALTATVIRANILNVRQAPTTGGQRIGQIRRGETYAVIGRDQNARWFLLQLGGYQGWSNGYYLAFNRNEFTAPVASGNLLFINPPQVPDFGVRAQTQAGLRLRAAPSTASEQTGRITWGAFLPVIARTADNQWWKVVWRETVGWIFAPFAIIVEGNINNVPIE